MRTKRTQKLVERLKRDLGVDIPADAEIRRTHAGWLQRADGAWSWFFYPMVYDVGSPHPIGEILRAKRISLYTNGAGQREILIENADLADRDKPALK